MHALYIITHAHLCPSPNIFIAFVYCKVSKAAYSSSDARWLLETSDGETHSTNFLFFTTGYYDYETPYVPEFKGAEKFKGQIVHPQHWGNDGKAVE